MPEYQKFQSINQPKPTTFNLMKIDTRPDKGWSFDDMLQDNRQGLQQQQAGSQEVAEEIQKQIKAERQLTRELSALTSGAKFLSTNDKLDIELVGTRFNRERFLEDSYIAKDQIKTLLPGGNVAVSVAGSEEARRRRLAGANNDEELAESFIVMVMIILLFIMRHFMDV